MKAEEAALRSIKDWENTFDSISDLIAIVDDKYRFVRVNKAMATRLGMIPEECVRLTCYNVVYGADTPSFCPYRRLLKDKLEHINKVH
jgi:PAS domain-containing protein